MPFATIGILAALSVPVFAVGLIIKKLRKFATVGLVLALVTFGMCLFLDIRHEPPTDQLAASEPVKRDSAPQFVPVPQPAVRPEFRYSEWKAIGYSALRLSGTRDRIVLSASGYPVVLVTKEWAVCANPFSAKEAGDAMKANRADWAASIPGCMLVPARLQAEWTKEEIIEGISEFRFQMPGGQRPITLYGTRISNYIEDWAGLLDQK